MSVHKETIAQLQIWKDAYKHTPGKDYSETESIILDLSDVLLLINEINLYNSSPASNNSPINALQVHLVRQTNSSFLTLANGVNQLNVVIAPLMNYDNANNSSGVTFTYPNGDIPTIYAVEGGENGGLCPPKNHGI